MFAVTRVQVFLRSRHLWSFLFAAFFFGFFVWPDVSSWISRVMVLAALVSLVMQPKLVADLRWGRLVLLLLPLLIYLASMTVHEWTQRQLGRPLHLAYATLVLLALREVRINSRVVVLAMASSLILALFVALYERFVQGAHRAFGPLSGADFGNFSAALAAGLGMVWLTRPKLPGGQLNLAIAVVTLVASASGLIVAVLSGSRTALLIAGLSLAAAVTIGVRHRVDRRAALFGVIALSVLSIPAWSLIEPRVAAFYQEATSFLAGDTAGYRSTSIGIRLESIRLGMQLCSEHPVLGIGYVQFKTYVTTLAVAGVISDQIPEFFGMLHNQFLDACMLLGLPGVLLLCVFWIFLFWLCHGCLREGGDFFEQIVAWVLAALTLGYFISATSGSMFSSTKGTVFICVAWALLLHQFSEWYPSAFYRTGKRSLHSSASR